VTVLTLDPEAASVSIVGKLDRLLESRTRDNAGGDLAVLIVNLRNDGVVVKLYPRVP